MANKPEPQSGDLERANQRRDNASDNDAPAKGEQESPPSTGEGREKFARVGLIFGLFITLFQSIDDFDSHKTRALLVICAGFGAWLWIEYRHNPGSRLWQVIGLPLVCWLIVATAIGVWWWKATDSRTSVIIWFPPEIPIECKMVEISFGGGGNATNGKRHHFDWRQSFNIEVLKTNDVDFVDPAIGESSAVYGFYATPIKLRMLHNRVYVNVDIPTDSAPIKIRNNNIAPIPLGWQCNKDDTAFEIVDRRGFPVFQIYYRFDPPSKMWVQARGLIISGNTVHAGGTVNLTVPIDYDPFNLGLPPIFQYPADKYPGKRLRPNE